VGRLECYGLGSGSFGGYIGNDVVVAQNCACNSNLRYSQIELELMLQVLDSESLVWKKAPGS
jgi:hypothetical protein